MIILGINKTDASIVMGRVLYITKWDVNQAYEMYWLRAGDWSMGGITNKTFEIINLEDGILLGTFLV